MSRRDDVLEYRGYYGSVNYSAPDKCLWGRVLGISDHITYEGGSVTEIIKDFEDSVDDYVTCCAEIGKEPERPSLDTYFKAVV